MNDYSTNFRMHSVADPEQGGGRILPTANQTVTSSTSSEAEASSITEDFRRLMAVMLIGMMMPTMQSSNGLLGGDMSGMTGMTGMPGMSMGAGFSMNALMAPIMLSLIDKLLGPETQQPASGLTAEYVSTAYQNQPVESPSANPQSEPFGMPAPGRLTQGSRPGHIALDFGMPVGTKIKATMDGKVVYAGWNNEGYGNLVIVENGPYRTYFAHLSEIPVSVGEKVNAGQLVGISGNTGNSTGPHLHYEVRKNGAHIDPSKFTLGKPLV